MPSQPRTSVIRSASAAIRRVGRIIRRNVLLRRRWLAAIFAAIAVAAGLRATSPPPPETSPMITAARDLPGGTLVHPADLAEVQVDPSDIPSGVVANPTGRVLASPLRKGEPVTDVRLVGSGLLAGHPGLTAVPVRIPDPAVVDLLRVGDTFDLLATDPEGRGTRHVADDVLVLAIPTSTDTSSIGLSGALIVVGTSSAEATAVANAAVREFLSIELSPQ